MILVPLLGKPAVFHGIVQTIIYKSDAFKIDLNTEDNFGKTGISYFKMQVQEELNAYGLKNNIVVLPDFLTTETHWPATPDFDWKVLQLFGSSNCNAKRVG